MFCSSLWLGNKLIVGEHITSQLGQVAVRAALTQTEDVWWLKCNWLHQSAIFLCSYQSQQMMGLPSISQSGSFTVSLHSPIPLQSSKTSVWPTNTSGRYPFSGKWWEPTIGLDSLSWWWFVSEVKTWFSILNPRLFFMTFRMFWSRSPGNNSQIAVPSSSEKSTQN